MKDIDSFALKRSIEEAFGIDDLKEDDLINIVKKGAQNNKILRLGEEKILELVKILDIDTGGCVGKKTLFRKEKLHNFEVPKINIPLFA